MHKYFFLKENEKLIEHYEEENAILKPYENQPNDEIVPFLWKLDQSKTSSPAFIPLEFVFTAKNPGAKIMFEKLKAQKEFLDCLVKVMIENDISDKLGVIMNRHLYQDHLNAGTFEDANEKENERMLILRNRENYLKEYPNADLSKTIKTTWFKHDLVSGYGEDHRDKYYGKFQLKPKL